MKIEELTINFPCPECKQEFQVRFYQLQRGGVVICPKCRATNAEAELEKLERDLTSWDQSLKNLKKCLNQNFGLKA
jgi:DNA-directed RNA polymerase subunit RPC12/RpoP